jgi:hypothetical protein
MNGHMISLPLLAGLADADAQWVIHQDSDPLLHADAGGSVRQLEDQTTVHKSSHLRDALESIQAF